MLGWGIATMLPYLCDYIGVTTMQNSGVFGIREVGIDKWDDSVI